MLKFLGTKANACCQNRLTLLCGFQNTQLENLKGQQSHTTAWITYPISLLALLQELLTIKAKKYMALHIDSYLKNISVNNVSI